MAYSHTTFAAAKSTLAAMLGDTGKVFWTDTELGIYIKLARRMWNALTGYDRTRVPFSTAQFTPFYDLTTQLAATRGYTVRDREVLSLIEYMLVEPQSFGPWTGSDMFSITELTSALTRARNQFLADTAVHMTGPTSYFSTPGAGIFSLPDSTIGVRRSAWRTPEGRYYQMNVSDEHMSTGQDYQWTSGGIPRAISVAVTPQQIVQIIPPPVQNGYLELLTVDAPVDLDPLANAAAGQLMNIPDDLTWGPMFGALASVLQKDGPARDPERAQWCKQWYDLAVMIARHTPVVMHAQLNGVQKLPGNLYRLDQVRPGWQGKTPGTPKEIVVAAPNLVGLYPVPDAAGHSVLLDIVSNAIVPSADGDFLQIGKENLEAVLGCAQQFALFKVGGGEMRSVEEKMKLFFAQAQAYVSRRTAASQYLQAMSGLSTKQGRIVPFDYLDSTGETADNSADVRNERNARRRGVKSV